MGILQPDIPVRRMASERKTKLNDALVRILRRFLTPATVTLPGSHDLYLRDNLLALAGHGDGHVLTVTVALLLAILTGRSDLCIAGVFGAGKTRSGTRIDVRCRSKPNHLIQTDPYCDCGVCGGNVHAILHLQQ